MEPSVLPIWLCRICRASSHAWQWFAKQQIASACCCPWAASGRPNPWCRRCHQQWPSSTITAGTKHGQFGAKRFGPLLMHTASLSRSLAFSLLAPSSFLQRPARLPWPLASGLSLSLCAASNVHARHDAICHHACNSRLVEGS